LKRLTRPDRTAVNISWLLAEAYALSWRAKGMRLPPRMATLRLGAVANGLMPDFGAAVLGAVAAGAFAAGAVVVFAAAFLAGAFLAGASAAGAAFAGAVFAGAFLAGAFFAAGLSSDAVVVAGVLGVVAIGFLLLKDGMYFS
jgi:hypothetical protein